MKHSQLVCVCVCTYVQYNTHTPQTQVVVTLDEWRERGSDRRNMCARVSVELKSTLESCVKLITYAKSEHFLEAPLWD